MKTDYQKQAFDFLTATGTSFKAEFLKHDLHFIGDKETRDIYKITLKKGGKQYSFNFGQSIANTGTAPEPYDVLACLTKYDPGSFEDFCKEYGYDEDSRNAEKTYKAVKKEYESVSRLFTGEEIELLQEIN